MGVVYHANYLVWFEIGRTDLLRRSGWSYREMEAEGFSLPVVEAQCRFHKGARYDDDLDIHARGTLLSLVRVRFDYEVVRAVDQVVLASGYTVHACVNPHGRPVRLPERVVGLFPRRDEARA